jgi:hypothetical protein
MYEKTGIRKYVMAIVLHGLRSFDEKRRRLVDGLECSTPGRNWIRSVRAVQWKKFVAITSLCSSGLRVFKIMWGNIPYKNEGVNLQGAARAGACERLGRNVLP